MTGGSHRTPYGEITSRWKTDGSQFVWKITSPASTMLTFCVPTALGAVVTEHRQPAETGEGVKRIGEEAGRAVFEVSSGKYEFQSMLP